MTNILIPTDFSVQSLGLAADAVQWLGTRRVNIVLFHAFEQPDDPHDLLNPSRQRPYAGLVTDEFRQACKRFREENPQVVQKIYIRILEGNTVPLFRRFLDVNEIHFIYAPDDFPIGAPSRLSVNPDVLFNKAGVPVIRELYRRAETSTGTRPLVSAVNTNADLVLY